MTAALSTADRVEIQDLMARYAWALDTGDVELFAGCFAGDGELVWDVFDIPGRWQGHDALRRFIDYFRGRPETAGRQHYTGNLLLTPTATGANARAYVLVALRVGDGPHRLNVMGYYEDELRREDGRWCLARRIIRDWSGPVLGRLAGQDGQRVARPRPPPLDGLWECQG